MIFRPRSLALGCCVLCAVVLPGSGAPPFPPAAQGIVDAERAFARLAQETNTREAFLAYLTDESITFSDGPQKGRGRTRESPAGDELLEWGPAFVDVAASGDFGYDLGPWLFWSHRAELKPVASGTFVTIWRKQPDNTWRVAVDLGASHPLEWGPVDTVTSAIAPKRIPVTDKSEFRSELMAAERDFVSNFARTGMEAYAAVLSSEARFYRPGQTPVCTPRLILACLKTEAGDKRPGYELLDGQAASTGDLGYVYGWVSVETAAEGRTATKRSNYLRIWKREDGRSWKLVLDVIAGN